MLHIYLHVLVLEFCYSVTAKIMRSHWSLLPLMEHISTHYNGVFTIVGPCGSEVIMYCDVILINLRFIWHIHVLHVQEITSSDPEQHLAIIM